MKTAQAQGELWGARATDWLQQEAAWREVYRTVLHKAGVGAGMRLLDIGCGAGGALVVGRSLGAEVAGLDAAQALVAAARERLPGARIEVGEMEELPFDDAAFDVVTGFNSFQFAGDAVQALAEARRVCKRGGTVMILVWGKREDCELVSGTMAAVFALLPPAPAGASAPAFAQPGVIEGLMATAGLASTAAGAFASPLVFPDAGAAARAVMSAAARAIRHAGEAAVREAVLRTLPQFTRPDGSVVWNNRFRWVAATPRL
jgi:SAM-dependent methyltransferase